eukprot:ANDGO_01620.mRNA.1 hypothetical protein
MSVDPILHSSILLNEIVAFCEGVSQLPVLALSERPGLSVSDSSPQDIRFILAHSHKGVPRAAAPGAGRLSIDVLQASPSDLLPNESVSMRIKKIEDLLSWLFELSDMYSLHDEVIEHEALRAKFLNLVEELNNLEASLSKYSSSDSREQLVRQRKELGVLPLSEQLQNNLKAEESMKLQMQTFDSQIRVLKSEIEDVKKRISEYHLESIHVEESQTLLRNEVETLLAEIAEKERVFADHEIVLKSILMASPSVHTPSKASAHIQRRYEETVQEIEELKKTIALREEQFALIQRSHPVVVDLQKHITRLNHEEREYERTHRVYSAMANYLVAKLSSEENAYAVALSILSANGNHMYLKDLKAELSDFLDPSMVLQVIYSLVAHSLIKIDRSEAENTVTGLL